MRHIKQVVIGSLLACALLAPGLSMLVNYVPPGPPLLERTGNVVKLTKPEKPSLPEMIADKTTPQARQDHTLAPSRVHSVVHTAPCWRRPLANSPERSVTICGFEPDPSIL